MKLKILTAIALTAIISLFYGLGTSSVFAENIDPYDDGSQYGYGENVGWLNFEPNKGPGVTVSDSNLTGYIWAENIGWINLWPAVYGGVFNDGNGLLSGYAWSENAGWINFDYIVPGDSNDYGVYIDACGDFKGLAWGENVGWISFGSDGAVFYRLTSEWISPIDTIAPETLPDIEILEWFNTSVNLTLLATDCGSGPNEVHYTLNGGDEVVTAGSSASLNVTGDGIHVLTFFSVDADGNVETAQEIVICIDTTPPVITLNGPAVITLECGIGSYVELGATVADNLDPAVVVVIGGDVVETSVCGVYNVTYDATDAAGNAAVQVTKEVTVQDTIPPVINITSPPDGTTYYVDEIILADFVVSDSGSGINTVTSTVPNGSPIDTATVSVKTFTVSATDNASNSNTSSHSYTVIPRGNIDPCDNGSQYAYGENVGWLNFEPVKGPGVMVSDSNLTGYIWTENIGWINLSPASYGGVLNDGSGQLSGYGWSENVGWINFAPTVPGDSSDYGVTIDNNGILNGWAWGENIGWIHLRSEQPIAYKVQSSWSVPNLPPVADAGSNQTVSTGADGTAQVTLDGSNSNDPDGDELTYMWFMDSQEIATGSNPTIELPCGTYSIELIVNDGIVDSEPDYVDVTVLDGTPPTITCPNDVIVECSESTDPTSTGTATASDNCDDSPVVSYSDVISGACPVIITRTWTAADVSGNSNSCVQTITVQDTTLPVFTTIPADISVECDGAGNQVELNTWLNSAKANDTCSDVTITNDFSDLSDDCGVTGSATVTWTATDECGNSNSVSATFTIVDTSAPIFTNSPQNEIVECDGAGNLDELNSWLNSAEANDICSDVIITNDFSGLSDECGATGSATVTWTATDECGNPALTGPVTFTIVDTTAPVFTSVPIDVVVQRDGNGNIQELNTWLGQPVEAADICGNVVITNNFSGGPSECGNTGSITVTWIATDDCGNSTTTAATFTINDPTANVTYDGDLLLSTEGADTINASLVAVLRDDAGNILDIDGEEVTFTLTAEGVNTIVETVTTQDGVASVVLPLEPAIYMVQITLGCLDFTTSAIPVVFNPDGGFATGGGWFIPADDGFNTYPDVRANFGFSIKYKQDNPTGHLEFRFSDGHIDLKSTSIEQLVITGGKIVQFRGWASVNGESDHWFFVKAIDKGEPGTSDTFEIKIWNPGSDIDGDHDEFAGGVLQGGNILVHSKNE